MGGRQPAMLFAAVPETAIRKYNEALQSKHKIRLADKLLISTPASDFVRPKYLNKP